MDDAASPEEARCHLDAWREQLHACYKGNATHPIAQNLQAVLRDFFHSQKRIFLALIEGVEMDLTKNRYDTFDELREYCYRVASVVGLICIEIFGYRNPQTREYAVNLGLALQLTNILRDVHTDWQQDRIYLPQEEMARFGYTEEALVRGDYNAAVCRSDAVFKHNARGPSIKQPRNCFPRRTARLCFRHRLWAKFTPNCS